MRISSKSFIANIKKELMSKIDKNSSIKKEKVERYINLVTIFYQLDESIQELGTMIETINGSQSFTNLTLRLQKRIKLILL